MATVYSALYRKECEGRFGITRDLVRDAIAEPGKEQHLSSQGLMLVLYSKEMKSGDHLLVGCHVQGRDLMVDLAFRLKKELVKVAKTTDPFRLLQALAYRVGLPVRVGERVSKFIYNEIIPVSGNDIKKTLKIENPEGHPLVSSIWVRILQNNMGFVAQCALVFCIDMHAYGRWLRRK
jgi:hypothetical protein